MVELRERIVTWIIDNGPGIIWVLIFLVVGFWAVRMLTRIIEKSLSRSRMDPSLYSFIKSLIGLSLKVVILITAATMLEIPMTSFITLLGAAGLAVGFALRDSLSNLAGGILILVFRPFNVGDFIETQGLMGTVKEIQLLYTHISTPDNRKLVIPNGELANGKITNFSAEPTRRIDLNFSIDYNNDIIKAKELLMRIVTDHPLVLEEPEPLVRVFEHGESSINFVVRVWCESQNYWPIYYDLQEEVKLVFDRENINIPFPQMDVHLRSK